MRNLLLNEGSPVTESSFLNNVKDTPGLHIVGDLFECSCNHKIFTDSKFLENTDSLGNSFGGNVSRFWLDLAPPPGD